jgi:hypothetical protein
MNLNPVIKSVAAVLISLVLLNGCGDKKEVSTKKAKVEVTPVSKAAKEVKDTKEAVFIAFTTTLPESLKDVMETAGGSYGLDKINGGMADSVVKSAGLIIEGWAIDKELTLVPENIYVRLKPKDGAPFYAKANRSERPDVAAHFNNDAFKNSGFTIKAVINNLPDGMYAIDVLQKETDKVLISDLGKILHIVSN